MTNRTNRQMLLKLVRRGVSILADVAYGIDAGNAIRHGLPVPPRRIPTVRRLSAPALKPADIPTSLPYSAAEMRSSVN